jgi:hypothetical protein
VYEFGRHPLRTHREHHLIDEILEPMARSTIEDFRHPGSHPGFLALDLLALGSAGAGAGVRVAAAGKAAKAGKAGAAAKALVRTPEPKPRILRHEKFEVPAPAMRNPAMRKAQELADAARRRFPERRLGLRTQPERVGFERVQNRRIEEAIQRFPAVALAARGKGLTAAENTALRAVAEGTSLEERIAFHRKRLKTARNRAERRGINKQLALLEAARPYVKRVEGKPIIDPANTKLTEIYAEAKKVAESREKTIGELHLLSPETIEGRVAAPGEIIRAETEGEVFGGGQGEFRVPYVSRRLAPVGSIQPGVARSVSMKTRAPGSLTHEFTGAHLKSGRFRSDTVQLVAESALEAERHAAMIRAKAEIARIAHDTYQSPYDIPVNLGVLKTLPDVVKQIQQKYEEGGKLSRQETAALGRTYDAIRGNIFPELKDIEGVPGIKFVDSRLIGGLNKPNPLVGFESHRSGKGFLTVVDEINDAQKLALVYLKPAFVIPNLLGNIALNLIQQGFAAPVNLANAARLGSRVGKETAAKIDTVMGEGVGSIIRPQSKLGTKAALNVVARGLGRVVDVGPRRASFLYEARRAGYGKPVELQKLIDEPHLRPKLVLVARRAQEAIGEYERLGPIERSIIRRLIFFYPFLKVAVRVTGRTVAEHPIKTAGLAQSGRVAKERQETVLGDVVPSYAEGIIPVGHRGSNPLTINPGAVTFFQTPADILSTIQGLGQGNVGTAFNPVGQFTPAVGAAIAALTRTDPSTGRALNVSPLQIFAQQMYQSQPLLTAYQHARQSERDRGKRIFPQTARDVGLQVLFGGLAPRPTNKRKLRKAAKREKQPR